jgi:hypothetical protein
MGFSWIINYTESHETVCVYDQRYLVATLDDTNKVERFGTFVRRIFQLRTCRAITRHLFPSNSPACPGFLFLVPAALIRVDFAG